MKKAILISIVIILGSCTLSPENESGSFPPIFPDYTQVTIPQGVAPLNFVSKNQCKRIQATFSKGDYSFTVRGKEKIIIPPHRWKKMVSSGGEIYVKVTILTENNCIVYTPFTIYISSDEIDSTLCYRRIDPGYRYYDKMGIYQRDLFSFKEEVVMENTYYESTCINCHSFPKCSPDKMQFHIRGAGGGTLLKNEEQTVIVTNKTDQTISACVYPYWHPSGKYIAYSVNSTFQNFHIKPDKILDVYDSASDIVIYDVENNKVLLYPALQSPDQFETFPAFSPDGKTLFFCSAPAKKQVEEMEETFYALYSVSFDPISGTIGSEIQKVAGYSSASIAFPRPSYDGNYLMYTLSDYGTFPIWHKEADLCLIDLATGETKLLNDLNSENTESYHSWSSNSKWVVFSSRRIDGLHTRLYISNIKEDGSFTKPFLLPQKDPLYYDRLTQSYNIPEFVKSHINLKPSVIRSAKRSKSLAEEKK